VLLIKKALPPSDILNDPLSITSFQPATGLGSERYVARILEVVAIQNIKRSTKVNTKKNGQKMARHFWHRGMESRRVLDLRGGGGIQEGQKLKTRACFYLTKYVFSRVHPLISDQDVKRLHRFYGLKFRWP